MIFEQVNLKELGLGLGWAGNVVKFMLSLSHKFVRRVSARNLKFPRSLKKISDLGRAR